VKICCVMARTKTGRVNVTKSGDRFTVQGTREQIGTPEKIAAEIRKFLESQQ
jgi:hypothetical protein